MNEITKKRSARWLWAMLGLCAALAATVRGTRERVDAPGADDAARAEVADADVPVPSATDAVDEPIDTGVGRRLVRSDVATDGSGRGAAVWRWVDDGAAGGAAPAPVSVWVDLDEDEKAILREHAVEAIGQLTAEADHAFVTAQDETEREAARERYDRLLNLGAKVVVDHVPDPPPEVIERQEAFLAVLPRERARVADRSPDEQERLLGEFKDEFFRDLLARAEETREP